MLYKYLESISIILYEALCCRIFTGLFCGNGFPFVAQNSCL